MRYEVPKKKITLAGLRNLKKLFYYLKPYRFTYFIGILLLVGSSFTNLLFPALLGNMVNAVEQADFSIQLNRILLILLGVLFVQAFLSYFRIILFVNVTEKTLADLRQSAFNHLIFLPMKFFQQRRVGELNSRISADITLLQDALTMTLAEFVRQTLIIIGGLSYMLIKYPRLTLFMIAIVPGIMLISTIFGRYIRKLSKQAQKKVADSNTIVEETLQGIQSVKIFTNELFEILRYRKRVEAIAKTNIKNGKIRGAFSSFIIIGLFGSLIAIIWRGAVLLGQGNLSVGDFISFIMYSVFIGGTFGGFASIFGKIQQFLGASEDLFEIFEESKEDLQIHIHESNKAHVDISGQIQMNGLTFNYPSRPDIEVLKNINISIPYNQTTAIVGPSGAGKSTLISLLLRLYEPSTGTIKFNRHLSSDIDLSDLRNQIALVPQDVFLFGGTIRENIAYGNTMADESKILEAAKMANASEFILKFPEGFDTIVGERGTQLSGGQRQRIAIARAILKNPKVLILDEATSSLDSESEMLVQEALEKVMKNRTSIVIAHRLSTIRKADHIIVLNNGEIVEQGNHDELVAIEGGLYKTLSELQLNV
jgi:ABC-type multidrug transport system fused ATPase/permease subunit